MRLLLVSLLLTFLAVQEVSAQIEVPFKVKTLNYTTRKKEAGVVVKVFQGNSVIQTFTSDATGEVNLKLPAGKKYKIEISKAGKVTRSVAVDVTNVNDELIQGSVPKGELDMSLFDEVPGVDYSYVTNNVATEYYYDGSDPNLIYDDVLADKMIKKVEKIMKETEAAKGQSDAQYNALIKQADGLYTQKKYQDALTAYEQALSLKPKEAHPAQRINEIDGILKAEKANAQQNAQIQQEYDNLITAADNLFNQKKFEEAKARYQEALTKKQEQHAKDQIVKCDTEIAKLKKEAENAQKYTAAIKAADGFFTQKSYQAAKDNYKEALKWKADDAYATSKLTEIESKLNAQKEEQEKKKKLDDANAAGDALMAQQKWQEAKAKFNEALTIDPSSAYASGKIKEIDAKLAEAEKDKQKQAQITKLLTEGNTAFSGSQWTAAKTKYQEVLKLDASNATANSRIAEIDAKLASDKADAEKAATIKKLLVEGDAALTKKDAPNARTKYQQVLTLDPSNADASAKLQDVARLENEMAGEAQKEAKFKQLKDEASTLMGQQKYNEAKQKLQEAKVIRTDAQVDQMIVQCDAKIAEMTAGAEKDKKYNALISEAQTLESSKQFDQAITKYNEALKIKNEQLPKDRIAAINLMKSANASQAKIEADYAAAMKRGNDALAAGNYPDAIKAFNEALALKPTEKEPSDKAAEAQRLSQKESASTEAAVYQKILDAGQKAIDEKNYDKAREMYNRALTFRATDPLPKQKLAEIDALVRGQEESKKKLTAYNAKVSEAESVAKSGDLQGAITLFEQAKAIKKDETLPDNRIAELKAQLEGKNTVALEETRRYQELMDAGAVAESAKEYKEALTKYKAASAIKPKEKLAQDKIAEMQQLLDNASKTDPKKAELVKIISKADSKFRDEKWMDAKMLYESALTVDPANEYAKAQIRLCDQNSAKKSKLEEDQEYKKILTKADENFDSKNYERAKELYQRAATFRATDPYPKQRLTEIEALLNPKPVVTSKEPEKLENLGTPTDNSIIEGESALLAAERKRKAKKYNIFRRGVEAAELKADSLSAAQLASTTATNQALIGVNKEIAETADNSEERRQENLSTIHGANENVNSNTAELDQYQLAGSLDAKGQIEAANKEAIEKGSEQEENSSVNNEVIKETNKSLTQSEMEASQKNYNLSQGNVESFKEINETIQQDVIDDTKEHAVTEYNVRMASNSIIEITEENDKRTTASIEVLRKEVSEITKYNEQVAYEETKQAPANKEELKKVEVEQTNLVEEDNKEHLENTLTYRTYVADQENQNSEQIVKRDDIRQENVVVVDGIELTQEEADRNAYNEQLIKTIAAKNLITTEVNSMGEYSETKQVVPTENQEKIKVMNNEKTEQDRVAAEGHTEKSQSNQTTLTNQAITVSENNSKNTGKTEQNAEVLRNAAGTVNQSNSNQVNKQENKTQEAKQLLASLEKKEIVYNNEVANDLGKLYPEGVSQEQFEQNDEDGLLKAIVTRRVVVRNGHGDVYVRIQTLSGLTYTKNGQPTTEYVWQRETQDALLKRNY